MTIFFLVGEALQSGEVTGVKGKVCKNAACTSLASELQKSMNTKVRPCDNFYDHACGKWADNHKIGPATGPVRDHYFIGAEKIHLRLRDILKTAKPREDSSLMKAKKHYEACIDQHREAKDILGIVKYYIKEAGGWPITMRTSQRENKKLTWQSVHSKFSSTIGASLIFTLSVVNDPLKSDGSKIPHVAPPTVEQEVPVPISKDPKVFIGEDAVIKYLGVIKDIVEIVKEGDSELTDAQLEKDAIGIFMFENNLRNRKRGSSVASKVRKIEDLQTLYDQATTKKSQKKIDMLTFKIDWLTFIRETFTQPKSSLNTKEKLDRLELTDESYFKLLPRILANTPERDIVNTIHWWFIKYTRSWNPNSEINEIMKKYIESSGVMKNQPPEPESWVKCIFFSPLRDAMGAAYVEKHFPANARTKVLRMINDIKSAMKNEIKKANWLDAKARTTAEEKLTAMIEFVGGPDSYTDSTKADAYYEGLSIDNSHFGNILRGLKFSRQKQWESLKKPADRQRWVFDPFGTNAAYIHKANSLTLAVGILQTPFFDVGYPDAVNYAGIGAIMGHEVSHGFDRIGNQYDKNGELKSWWSPNTRQKYETRSKCFETQFNAYWKGLGTRTLNENIADTTGVKIAFAAFKIHMTTSEYKDESLPGFKHLSPEQLFFLSYASIACENIAENYVETYMKSYTHAPKELRVKGALSNSDDFASAFDCPKGIGMNPMKKCNTW